MQSVKYINTNIDNTSTAERVISFFVWDLEDSSNVEERILLINEVKPEPDFITAFTPNADGVNDIWEIRKIGAYNSVAVFIYDSKGQLVFQSDDYKSLPWDGRLNGKDLPAAAYYYKVNLNHGEREYQGNVNILR